MKTIRIAVKKPTGGWQARTVEDSLPTYQKIVGGYIEHFDATPNGIEFFCNEEGRLQDLPENILSTRGEVIRGTIFAVRANPAGEFESLTDKDLFDLFCMPETVGKYALYQGAVMCQMGDTCIKDGKEYTEVTFDNGEVSSVLSEELETKFDLNEGNEEA